MELSEESSCGKRNRGCFDSFGKMTAYCHDLLLESMDGFTFRMTGCEVVLSFRSVGTR